MHNEFTPQSTTTLTGEGGENIQQRPLSVEELIALAKASLSELVASKSGSFGDPER